MELRVPHTAPSWLGPRRIATCAAMIAAPTIVARELVLLEPGIFPLHHPLALAVAIAAPLAASLVVFRRFGAILAFVIGYVLPIVSLAVLNVVIDPRETSPFHTIVGILGTPPFHLVALPIAIAGAWLFGVGHANANRVDGPDRVAVRAGAFLVAIGAIASMPLFSYSGTAPVPIGGWVLAAWSAIAVGSGLGAIAVGVLRRRALARFLRRARDEQEVAWRVRPEVEGEILEARITTTTDPYRTVDHYQPIARVP